MPSICLYFQVHQPMRIKKYKVFDVGSDHNYFNDAGNSNLNNKKVLEKVVNKSYLPANKLLLRLLKKYPKFKISYSFSGVLLQQLSDNFPNVLKSFKSLIKTSRVEILSETYHHSLAFFYSLPEFERQVKLHSALVSKLFSVKPKVFRNTELAYNNALT